MWWNDEIKAAFRRKEGAWKMLVVSNEEAKESFMEAHRERLKGIYIRESK